MLDINIKTKGEDMKKDRAKSAVKGDYDVWKQKSRNLTVAQRVAECIALGKIGWGWMEGWEDENFRKEGMKNIGKIAREHFGAKDTLSRGLSLSVNVEDYSGQPYEAVSDLAYSINNRAERMFAYILVPEAALKKTAEELYGGYND